MGKLIGSTAVGILGLLLSTQNAYAYLDPGTGSMLLQGLIGGVAAGLVAIKLYWHNIKAFISRRRYKSDAPGEDLKAGK